MWGVTGIYLAFPDPFTALGDYLEPFDEESFEPRTVDMILYWVARVHFGRFGGTVTRVSWFAIGLLPPVLFVTGAIMWWNRVVRAADGVGCNPARRRVSGRSAGMRTQPCTCTIDGSRRASPSAHSSSPYC